ncbi:glutathione S-transferase N-terminal domain-containing protein [Cupriavidus taiwanensis]|uniref:glutathione S-transferase N-terminal domain-containing protein n=1 Tax=Cupriavidus taiwanensis TaxID=164546 RepID=UPI00254189AF|nr:glutathione S-transferase N-terminal domain-containing protein [Cupriavidus taiwanensis]MDK3022646.1 glutathione S-transferase N-terminal domain-containing protein [Cupriavidus taiwanensis]
MKLLYSPGSPYARKVRIVIREKGLAQSVEEIVVNPHQNGAGLLALNPLAKVPALETDDGAFFDSPIICEYLDSLSAKAPLLPPAGLARFEVLRYQALADGIMDAAVASVLEQRRADTVPSQRWLQRWEAAISRATQSLAEVPLPSAIRLDGIAIACALAYLTFRLPGIDWRSRHGALARWFNGYTDRASFAQTAPPDL